MLLCRDRDAEAAANIERTRAGLSSINLGSSGWDNGMPKFSDAGEAFRVFSKSEMDEVRGQCSEEVQKDLRAVHWRYGFQRTKWESEEMLRSKSLMTKGPEKQSKSLHTSQFFKFKSQFKLGSEAATDYDSGSKADHRVFSKAEIQDVKAVMADSVKKDLRAVHFFAPHDKATWKSEAMHMGPENFVRAPERMAKDFRHQKNVYLGGERLDYMSDARAGLREFSKKEMDAVRGTMAEEVQADLRAVHFKLGTDKGVLDRHIRDRHHGGPVRPMSAVQLRNQRPQSASW